MSNRFTGNRFSVLSNGQLDKKKGHKKVTVTKLNTTLGNQTSKDDHVSGTVRQKKEKKQGGGSYTENDVESALNVTETIEEKKLNSNHYSSEKLKVVDEKPKDKTNLHLFIDSPNLWLNGKHKVKKVYDLKLKDQEKFHPLSNFARIDFVKLFETILKNSELEPKDFTNKIIYYSTTNENTDVDEFENYLKAINFETKRYHRKAKQGEKQVDTSICFDIGYLMGEKKIQKLILITGDLDMMPAVKKSIELDIEVVMFSWEIGCNEEYKILKKQNNKTFSLHYLDDFASSILYLSVKRFQLIKHVDLFKNMDFNFYEIKPPNIETRNIDEYLNRKNKKIDFKNGTKDLGIPLIQDKVKFQLWVHEELLVFGYKGGKIQNDFEIWELKDISAVISRIASYYLELVFPNCFNGSNDLDLSSLSDLSKKWIQLWKKFHELHENLKIRNCSDNEKKIIENTLANTEQLLTSKPPPKEKETVESFKKKIENMKGVLDSYNRKSK
jgi:uncharacterized LabA/DUF88 family protein